MLLYPEAQRAVQKELDCITGKYRQPEMDDKDSLPYITAVVKEVLRQVLYLSTFRTYELDV